VKVFLGFVGLLACVGAVKVGLTLIEGDDEAYESRLIGALNVVETAIQAISPDVERADLFTPSMESGSQAGAWDLTAVAAILDVYGAKTHQPLVASLRTTCKAYAKPECWQIDSLTVGGTSLPVEDWDAAAPEDLEGANADEPQAAGSALPDSSDTESGEAGSLQASQQATSNGTEEAESQPTDQSAATAASAAPSTSDSQSLGQSTEAETLVEGEKLVRLIQEALRDRGYDAGPGDGRMGPQTMSAILAYQRSHGLPVDGAPTRDLLVHLRTAED
jgi:hypothetical protein